MFQPPSLGAQLREAARLPTHNGAPSGALGSQQDAPALRGGGRAGAMSVAAWQGTGEAGLEGWGALGVSFGPTSGKWEASGLTDAGKRFVAFHRVKAQKIKVADIKIFLLECSDYKNKTCFL